MTSLKVRALQLNLNARLRARGRKQITVDGVYGEETREAVHLVKYLLGFPTRSLEKGPTPFFLKVVARPNERPFSYLAVAADRAAYQAKLVKARPLGERAFNAGMQLLGVMEEGGNNRGREVARIILANGGVVGEPWCGDFVAWCYRAAGSKSVTRSWAAVRLLLAGRSVREPRLGDIVRYSFDHTGLFRRWVDGSAGVFEALEGNTGASGAVSDSKTGGDGVYLKRRHVSQVADFRRVTR